MKQPAEQRLAAPKVIIPETESHKPYALVIAGFVPACTLSALLHHSYYSVYYPYSDDRSFVLNDCDETLRFASWLRDNILSSIDIAKLKLRNLGIRQPHVRDYYHLISLIDELYLTEEASERRNIFMTLLTQYELARCRQAAINEKEMAAIVAEYKASLAQP